MDQRSRLETQSMNTVCRGSVANAGYGSSSEEHRLPSKREPNNRRVADLTEVSHAEKESRFEALRLLHLGQLTCIMTVDIDIPDGPIPGSIQTLWASVVTDEWYHYTSFAIHVFDSLKVFIVGEQDTGVCLRVLIFGLKQDDRSAICDLGFCENGADFFHITSSVSIAFHPPDQEPT